MATNKRLDESISKWLEESASPRLPERVLNATFERTRKSRQHVGWRGLLRKLRLSEFAFAAGSAAVVLVVVGLAAGLYVNRPGIGGSGSPMPQASPTVTESPLVEPTPTPSPTLEPTPTPSPTLEPTPMPSPTDDPRQRFLGVWVSTSDADGGTQTMNVSATDADGAVTIDVTDTIASVCGGISSTMTGTGSVAGNTLVIPAPHYACDDGSEPHLLNGDRTPIDVTLRNLTFTYVPRSDTLGADFGSTWRRHAAR